MDSKRRGIYYFSDTDFGVRIGLDYPVRPDGNYGLFHAWISPDEKETGHAKLYKLTGEEVLWLIALKEKLQDRIEEMPPV